MDMRELYQEIILDHYKRPRNSTVLEGANRQAAGHNPLCGDRIRIYLKVEDGVVEDVGFEGAGCAISTASASMMTEAIKGKTVAEAQKLFESFKSLVTGQGEPTEDVGKLEALSGVREIPIRVKCATLAWHTLKEALKESANGDATISTE